MEFGTKAPCLQYIGHDITYKLLIIGKVGECEGKSQEFNYIEPSLNFEQIRWAIANKILKYFHPLLLIGHMVSQFS